MSEGWSEMSAFDALAEAAEAEYLYQEAASAEAEYHANADARAAETGSFPINVDDLWDGIWLADIDDLGPLHRLEDVAAEFGVELDDEDYPNEVTD
jgi:hypothetical protein